MLGIRSNRGACTGAADRTSLPFIWKVCFPAILHACFPAILRACRQPGHNDLKKNGVLRWKKLKKTFYPFSGFRTLSRSIKVNGIRLPWGGILSWQAETIWAAAVAAICSKFCRIAVIGGVKISLA